MKRYRLVTLAALLALGGGSCANSDAVSGDGAATMTGEGGSGGGGGGSTGTGTGTGAGTGTGGRGGAGGTAGATGNAGSGGGGPAGSGGASAGTGGAGGAGGSGGSGGTGGSAGAGGGGGTGGQGGAGGTPANLPPGVAGLFPRPNAQGLCADPPLRITFPGTPTIGTAGSIRVFNAAGTSVATVDVAAATSSDTLGGMLFNTVRPVYIDGNDVVVYPRLHALAYGQTYYVNVDSGAIRGPGGAALSITGTTAWRFSTAAAAPTNRSAVAVALDGSAPFCTVQGAIDFVPANNTAAVTITLAPGTYHEIVHFTTKNNLTLQGQDRARSIIAGTNNDLMNPGTRARSLIGIDNSTGLTIRNLTIHNLTPQGGSQAEALRLQGCDMCVVRDATIISLQDTLLWAGRIYANNVLIEGNVDYVWGTGTAYFANSEIRTIGRSGPIVQARNTAATYGYVFVDSKITSDPGLINGVLARIDVSVYPASHVAYVNCQVTPEISAAGWTITATASTSTSMLRFWEYKSVDTAGNPVNIGGRVLGSRQITDAEAAMMRNPSIVLAGWQPPVN